MIQIFNSQGFRGLWKGLTPAIIGHIPSSVIYYVGYDYLKEYIQPAFQHRKMESYAPMLAGSIARCTLY